MRLLNVLQHDIKFQFRHGFYYAYLFVTIFYVFALVNIPTTLRASVTTIVIFTDTTMLGFFFIGAIVLLEKGQNIFESLFITPLKVYEYMLAKLLSLALIAVLSAELIMFFAHGAVPNHVVFSLGLLFNTMFYTLFGVTFAARAENVNDYFAKALGGGLLLCLPLLGYFNIIDSPIFYLFPSQATLVLIETAFREVDPLEIAYAFGSLGVWLVIAAKLAYQSFYQQIILKVGGNQ